jgi:hypothetical protein
MSGFIFTTATIEGPIEVVAYETETPGLCVHLSPKIADWAVAHRDSGVLVTLARSRADAVALAVSLGPCGDWTRSGREVAADSVLKERAKEVITHSPHRHTRRRPFPAAAFAQSDPNAATPVEQREPV